MEEQKYRLINTKSCYYNTKIKIYPDGRTVTTYCNNYIYAYEEDILFTETKELKSKSDKNQDVTKKDYQHLKRAKDKCFDIIFMNDWSNWITFTFDPEKVDSTDKELVMQKLKKWLSNQQQRNGLQYFMIPEYHKRSQNRIHVHCLTNDTLELIPSEIVKVDGIKKPMRIEIADAMRIPEEKRHSIYNVGNWKYGFSTCEKIYGTTEKIATYIQKYMTKDLKKIFGKYYWSSRGIIREPEIIYTNTDYESIDAEEHYCKEAKVMLKYETGFDYNKK